MDSKGGFIDYNVKVNIPLIYDDTITFFYGLAKIVLGKKQGFINKK
jgi:hypothetical protein